LNQRMNKRTDTQRFWVLVGWIPEFFHAVCTPTNHA
jgi:hypothetical protein